MMPRITYYLAMDTKAHMFKLHATNCIQHIQKVEYPIIWILGCCIYLLGPEAPTQALNQCCVAFTIVSLCILCLQFLNKNIRNKLSYLLFFAITLTSLFGITQTLTGSHAEATNPMLFGLSFYSTSLAYLIAKPRKLMIVEAFKIANPLLLITGPIALFIKRIKGRSIHSRINYYLPYMLVGLFYYQVIAVPLTESFTLIQATDLVSSLVFGAIFELFVYANFCGLSLMIYGLFGLFSYQIPLNFRQPFSSNNLIDFWRGWHTSLSTVLKTLFYNPIKQACNPTLALFGVFLASAMWHGVTFNFLLWGSFHASMFLATKHLLKKQIRYAPTFCLFIGIVLGRMLFADSDTNRLIQKLSCSYEGFSNIASTFSKLPSATIISLIVGFGLIAIEYFARNTTIMHRRNYKHLRTPIALFLLALIGTLTVTKVGIDFAVYGQR